MTTLGFHIHQRPMVGVSEELIDRYRKFAVANISDVMSRITGTSALAAYHMGGTMVGRALTVRTRPGDNLMVHKAIDLAERGDVIVVDAGGVGPNAIIGEIMVTLAKSRGIAGFVIDGLIRDTDAIGRGTFPVYARGVSHRGPYKDGPGEIHAPVTIDGMVVMPGDLIVGDRDGLLAINPAVAQDLAANVETVQSKEAGILNSIEQGTLDRSWIDASLRDKGVL